MYIKPPFNYRSCDHTKSKQIQFNHFNHEYYNIIKMSQSSYKAKLKLNTSYSTKPEPRVKISKNQRK